MRHIEKDAPYHIEKSGRKRFHLGKCIDCGAKTIQKSRPRCRPCGYKKREKPLEVRFWKFVNKTADCWLWKGAHVPAGYGVIGRNGGSCYAHRASWIIHFGEIPKGKNVLHHCDNPPCIRPDHLWVGTNADNIKDKVFKNRHPMGEKSNLSKLTEKDVLEIRSLWKTGEYTTSKLAKKFGCIHQNISMITQRKTWKHI